MYLYLPSDIADTDSLFPRSNHFSAVRVRESTSTTPVDFISFLNNKKAVLDSYMLNSRGELSLLSHDYFPTDLMYSDYWSLIGLLLLTCESTDDTAI